MATKKSSKQSKLSKLMKVPLRVLIKARDFYIKSMSEYSDRIGYGTVMGCPTGQVVYNLPKSYSVNSTKSSNHDEDYRELLRAASTRGLSLSNINNNRVESLKSPKDNNMKRSYSVGIGRIDEEKECEFGDDIKVNGNVFPRSRSYAVSKRNTPRMF